MPSPSPPFTFYQLQMEIKEEATSSKLYFKQTNLSKEIQHNIKGKIKEFTKCLKSEEKNWANFCGEYFENFSLVNPVKVMDPSH